MQRRTSQAWRELIELWQSSELTQKQFCAQQSIAYSAFHYWFKKFRQPEALLEKPGFVSVKISSDTLIEQNSSARIIELVLPDGRRVNFYQGIDVDFLRALLS